MPSNPRARVPKKANFVHDLLTGQPNASLEEANDVWRRRGNKDPLSRSLYYRVKAQVAAGGTQHVASGGTPERSTGGGFERQPHTGGRPRSHESSLDQLEGQIDDLMFRAREAGGLQEVENALRQARRLLVRSQSS